MYLKQSLCQGDISFVGAQKYVKKTATVHFWHILYEIWVRGDDILMYLMRIVFFMINCK